MSTKQTRKELLKKEDAFLAAANQSVEWIGSHRLPVIGAAVLVVLAIGGTWATLEYIARRDRNASELFARGMALLEAQVVSEGSESSETTDPPTFASEQEKWTAARAALQKVLDETGGSGVATLAAFLVADLDERLGNADAALKGFVTLADRLSTSDSLFFLAVERAAYLQEAKGESEAALRTLSRIANGEGGFYRDYAGYHMARLHIAKGDTERARNLLEGIEKDHADSSVAEKARERLQALGPAPAGTAEQPKGDAGAVNAPAEAPAAALPGAAK